MTTLTKITLICPICSGSIETQDVVSTNAFGGKRTDFQERAAGDQPLPYLIHLCTGCGFAGYKNEFEEQSEFRNVDRFLFKKFLTDLTYGLDLNRLTAAEKFELAAKIAIHENMSHRHIANRYLHAAWACVNDRDIEAERFYRIKSAEHYEAFLSQPWIPEDELGKDSVGTLCYLTGEIWRRAGFVKKAAIWFDKVPDHVADPVAERWVIDAAKQQKEFPREWFG